MDKIEKALQKLSSREVQVIKKILLQLNRGDFRGMDCKKLRGHEGIYRVRKGILRIIYLYDRGEIQILAIERRSEKTYRRY